MLRAFNAPLFWLAVSLVVADPIRTIVPIYAQEITDWVKNTASNDSRVSDDHSHPPLIIAHRGASGYLPEHTLAANALAFSMGADYVEQDVVLSKDGQPLVLHDLYIDTVTDVAKKFPGRHRGDGRYYAIDFNLAEIKTLRVMERLNLKTGQRVYPNRFPDDATLFTVATLDEIIELVRGLNHSMSMNVGIYVELKAPAWHTEQGQDIAKVVLDTLTKRNFPSKNERIFLQCFDDQTLIRLKNEFKTTLPLIQLIGENEWSESTVDYNAMRTPEGLRKVATYAVGIGPSIQQIYLGKDESGDFQFSSLVSDAQALGLKVHPYTFRVDALPTGIKDIAELLEAFLVVQRVDGVFTDFPDSVHQFLKARN